MRIDLLTKNYKEGNRLLTVIETKLKKLEKYFGDDAVARVQLSGVNGGDKFTMEISISEPTKPLVRAEVTTDNMYDNIDIIIPKLEKQIARFRSRFEKEKVSIKSIPVPEDKTALPVVDDDDLGKIVKIKKFEISIITVEEAVAELELLDHNFYVFVDADTNKVSVVYKRHDSDYGLISPEY